MLKHCAKCGFRLLRGSRFCPQCGAAVGESPETLTQSNDQPAPRTHWGWRQLIGFAVLVLVGLNVIVPILSDERSDNAEDTALSEAVTRPIASPTTTPTLEEVKADYPPLADVRDLDIRAGNYENKKLSFVATVFSIDVAKEGSCYEFGNAESGLFGLGGGNKECYRSVLQVNVEAPDRDLERVVVGYDEDPAGVFEGTEIRVYATVVGARSGENAFGVESTHPVVEAWRVEVVEAG